MTKWQLFEAFASRKPISIPTKNEAGRTVFTTIESIEHEDGSGHCFNVTGFTAYAKVTVFVRTID